MGFWDELTQGLASAADDIRHQVVEQGYFGQQTTGDIELPQQQEAAPAQSNAWQDLTQDMGTIQPPEIAPPDRGMEQ